MGFLGYRYVKLRILPPIDEARAALEQDVLTIFGEKKFGQTEGAEKENFHFIERSYGAFQTSLRLG